MPAKRSMAPSARELRDFRAQNPEFDLLSFDFHEQGASRALRWEGADREGVLSRMRARQRVMRLGGSEESGKKLLTAGFHSAHQIAAVPENRFVREHGGLFAGEDEARAVHRRAVAIRSRVQHVWANVRDLVASRHYRGTRFYNAQDDIAGYFQQIPSYQDLFGGLDYLACPHCRSILSPAAYFTDLMRITDEYVTYPNTHKGSGNIPDGLLLEQRRPDLFTLPLNCENTDTVVPYLRIVNEVLEQKLKLELNTAVYPSLALAPYPFNLPFNLPLQQIRGNLAALTTTLADVYTTLSGPFTAGQARGGAAGTITLAAAASERDGYYLGMELTLTAGPGAGQARQITGYDGATRTAEVSPHWQGPPTGQTRYEVRDAADVARERLGLSPEQYQLETTPATAEAQVARGWGYPDLSGVLPSFAPGTGQITFARGGVTVDGTGTRFAAELSVGDQLWSGTQIRTVAAIAGPASLTVDQAWSAGARDAAYLVARWPAGDGAITIHRDSTQVTGDAGAHFERLAAGDQLQCIGEIRTVVEVRGPAELLVDSAWRVDAANAAYTVSPVRQLTRMTTFLDRTGLTRPELEALFRQDTSEREFEAGVTQRFFINATAEGLPPLQLVTDRGDPGNSFQRIVGLSVPRLDRLSRFIRLQRALGWTAADTEWVMSSARAAELDGPVIEAMAATRRLAAAGTLPVDVVTSFWSDLKTIGRVDETRPQDLFDRVYNAPALLRGQDPYTSHAPIPFDPARPLTWDIDERTAGSDDAVIRSRLLGALGLTDDDLSASAHFVRALQGRPGRSLVLDLPALSWLYRVAKQAAWSQLTIDEYLRMLWLLFYPAHRHPLLPPEGSVPLGIAATARIEAAVQWLRASPFTVYQLQYVIAGLPSPYVEAAFTTRDLSILINGLAAAALPARLRPGSLAFGNIRDDQAQEMFQALVTMGLVTGIGIVTDKPPAFGELASLLPLTPGSFVTQDIDAEQSAQAFTELAAHVPPYLIAAKGSPTGVLSEVFTPETSLDFLFSGDQRAREKQREVRAVLLQARQDIDTVATVLKQAGAAQEAQAEQGVAGFLRVDRELLRALLSFCAGQQSLAAQRAALLTPLPAKAPLPPGVETLLTALARGALWTRALGYTPAELAAVTASPRPFGISDPRHLTLADVRELERFRRLTADFNDVSGVLLEYFGKPPDEATALLAGLTGWSAAQITRLAEVLWPAAGGRETMSRTVEGVRRLQAAFGLCDLTGTDAFFLIDLLSLLHLTVGVIGGTPDAAAWAAYEQRAGTTLDAVSGRYGDTFAEADARVSGETDTAKRDAMVGHTIWLLRPDFPFLRTPADLYQFLLIDVEMSDCATTSPIAQGIGSVQLYLQRCRMSLEQGVTELDVDPRWWDWLASYRIWEANRKIFLYPENYLQPQLRSGQSPEFRRLAGGLLQTDLSQGAVADTFLKYFDELDGLANLVPVASHNADVSDTADDDAATRLFVVSRPRTDPYSYFWRTHDPAGSWAAWQKIDLSITSPEVAAVYAFGRLFLFWSELDKGKSSTISQAEARARYVGSAALQYSFLAVSGQWVQPQTLAATVPTEVEPNPYTLLDAPPVKAALTPSGLYWKQPYPFRVPRGLAGSGRLVITKGLINVSGADTLFRREIRVGDRIRAGGQTRVVDLVVNDTSLAVTQPWARSARDAEFNVIPERPGEDAFPPFDGAGTVTITAGSGTVTGAGSEFTREVSVGDRILCANEVRTVLLVASRTNLLVDEPWNVSRGGERYVVVPGGTGAEQLVVMFGGALSTAAGIDPEPPVVPLNPGRDPFLAQLEAFDYGVFYSATLAKEASGTAAGQVTLNYSAVLDHDLQVQDARTLVTNYGYSASDNPRPYQYRLDRSERVLQAAQSDNAIADNYWGSSAPGTPLPPKPAGPSRGLLFNVSPTAMLRNVGNQLGWAVFDNGDEAFLVRSTEAALGQLSTAVISRRIPDAQLGEAVLLSSSAFSDEPANFDDLSFTFTRLTTSVVSRLRRRLLAGGIGRLLSLDSQLSPELPFRRFYTTPESGPPPWVIPPPDVLDFEGSYGLYFQEIFLFCPWLVADRLSGEQRFEDAKSWYEYIFNPTEQPTVTDTHPNDRYWRYLPFRKITLDSLIADLTDQRQVAAYNDEPFDPDAIARLRPAAYPKAVVLGYINNLLRWGDFLFARDTAESIGEATQLYVLAAELLGPRPREVGACPVPPTQDFARIRERYQRDIPQFLIDLENGLPALMNSAAAFRDVPVNDIRAYFCVPENSELIAYWDRVDDRLFKIRHCMNLQGVVRQLALFEPPLAPGQLVRARASGHGGLPAAGVTPGPLPVYRFTTMIERAKAFAGNVTALGAELLSALEKQDAEQLALLGNSQESALLDLTVQMKELQVQLATDTGEALTAALAAASARRSYYHRMIDTRLSPEELANLDALEAGLVFNVLASVARTASSIAYTIPQVGSPFAMTYGGVQIGSALAAGASVFEIGSIISQFYAQKSLTMAGYQRRNEEWELQLTLAGADEAAAVAQLAANDTQRQLSERDLRLTLTSIAQNREMRSFLLRKFTSEQLYQWMAGQLSEAYFQAWLLALEFARATERAFQYELNTSATFLDFVSWDGARKGLLAGESLGLALSQLEKAYLEGNVRTLEIEKTVSLARVSPRALLDLKATGECVFQLSERLFDFDFPGQYCRKLKSVSVTIPAVIGPYQSVHATLTQLGNATVLRPDIEAIRYLLGSATAVPSPDVLRSGIWVSQQIALSQGINDGGMFQLDFSDPRFLPFEGTGAVSTWRLSMPPQTNRFDFSSISDVLIQVSYTARDGGTALRQKVVQQPELRDYAGSPLLSLAQLYSQEWHAFMADHADPAAQALRFEITRGIVPPHLERPQLEGFFFQLVTTPGGGSPAAGRRAAAADPYVRFRVTGDTEVTFAPGPNGSYSHAFERPIDLARLSDGHRTIEFLLADTPGQLKEGGFLNPAVVSNIALILYYRATVNWT
ncbi:MAG TPA: neuraminidase-like domain-containing protein [Streptosporangiaceae bacterium]|nr:neuraminidase-like domain-containing protein [Streptosporangiaceae bacterium]